ncbi:MAG: LLM class F420-dependent oxidoreductase [Candidatus Binatia bacterium]
MEIGVFLPLANPVATPEYVRVAGLACEEVGVDSIWVAEHVVLFDSPDSKYPYAADGKFPLEGETGFLEPFTALSFLAACTERVRLGTGIVLAPQRNPVYTAKEAACVDWLSNGRLDLGLGIGWLEEEFNVCNVPFERRAARCREYIEVMRTLWCDPVSEHSGEFYSLPPCRHYPKPIQDPHPPIHFGGESGPALRRVADLGTGWYGYDIGPEETITCVATLRELLEARGRRMQEVKVSVCPYLRETTPELLEKYRDAGVDQVIVLLAGNSADKVRNAIDSLARDVVEPAHSL